MASSSFSSQFTANRNGAPVLTQTFTNTFDHTLIESVTLDPGGTTTHAIHFDSLDAGRGRLMLMSKPSGTAGSPVFTPFTVAINGGTAFQVSDFFSWSFESVPSSVVLGLPVGATDPVNVDIFVVGQ